MNNLGESTVATSASVIVGSPAAPPVPHAQPAGSGKIKVTFTKPAANGSSITSYIATCTSSNGGKKGTKTGTTTSLTVAGLTHGKKYACNVRAKSKSGLGPPSPSSNAVTA